jgi:hypothetical protein
MQQRQYATGLHPVPVASIEVTNTQIGSYEEVREGRKNS